MKVFTEIAIQFCGITNYLNTWLREKVFPTMATFHRLFVSDIIKMKKGTGGYLLGKQMVRKVDILGVVTFKREGSGAWIFFQVDDGTGVIDCLHRSPVETTYPEPKRCMKGTKALLEYVKRNATVPSKISIGDTVHIRGPVAELKKRRGIIIKAMRLVTDRNEEVTRVLVTEALHRDVYDIPESSKP